MFTDNIKIPSFTLLLLNSSMLFAERHCLITGVDAERLRDAESRAAEHGVCVCAAPRAD